MIGPEKTQDKSPLGTEFERIALRLAGIDLDAWFADAERRAKLAEWLHTELGCPKPLAQLGVKALAPLASKSIKVSGAWVAKSIQGQVVNRLLTHPEVDKFLSAIEAFASKIDGELAAKRAFEAKVLKLSPSAADFRFQLEPELLGQMAQMDAMASMRDDLQKIINRQPKLDLTIAPDQAENRFIYRSRHVSFVGRDAELALLDQFLGVEKDFAWALVSGPGGMGKSRLALEFLITKAGAFAAGFLSRDNLAKIDWGDWQPVRPTLMVIDYAALDSEAVSKIPAELSLRQSNGTLGFPVRLLLLERTADGPWLETVKCTGSNTYKAAVRESFVRLGEGEDKSESAGDLALQPIAKEVLWEFMGAIIAKQNGNVPEQDEILTKLEEIDPQMRPLYAAFLADAVGRGEDARNWDRQQLLDDVVSYERRTYWVPNGITEPHENLLALATARGGLLTDEIKAACSGDEDGFLPDWNAIDIDKAIKAFHGTVSNGFLPPLEPDVLGEVFTLKRLEDCPPFIPILAELAWTSDPFPYAAFLDRLAQDFPTRFLPPLAKAVFSQHGNETPFLAAILSVNLITDLAKTDEHLHTAIDIYGELKALASEQHTPEIWLRQARGAYNLITDLAKTDEHRQTAFDIYGELKAFAKEQDTEEIWLLQAMGAVNLTSRLGEVDEHRQTAIDLYSELRTLAETQDTEEIWRQQAMGAVNLINRLGEVDEHRQTAIDLYGELKTLAETQDAEEIWRQQAMGAYNLITDLAKTDEHRHTAIDIYGELKVLAKEQDTPGIWLQHAKAAVNLINRLGEVDEHRQTAIDLYGELKTLAETQNTEEIWRQQAMGAVNLISDLGGVDEHRQTAIDLYSELRTLAETQNTEEIWRQQAMGAVNLISDLGGVDEHRQTAIDIYGELKTLAETQDAEEICLLQATGAVNLISDLGGVDEQRQTAIDLYGELKTLAETQDAEEICLLQATGAVNLISDLGGVDEHRQTAIDLYGELKTLADAQDTEEIWLEQAKAAVNLINRLGEVDEYRQTAIDIYGELKTLAETQDTGELWQRYSEGGGALVLGSLLLAIRPESDYFAESLDAFLKSNQELAAPKFVVTAALHLRASELESNERFSQEKERLMQIGDLYDASLPQLNSFRRMKLGEKPQD